MALTTSLALPLLWLLLWKLPQAQVAAVRDRKDRVDLESKSRQTLAQIVGGVVLLGGLYVTAQTLRTTQEGQITDRFTKAIDQLGKDNLAVRLGGIYALERIARDSEYDHPAVIEVLTTFVREQTQGRLDTARSWLATLLSKDQDASQPPADIQAILTVLGRRKRTYGKGESQPLNLSGSQIRGAYLYGAHLEDAYLYEVHLEDATLAGAQLKGATLYRAQLEDATLYGAQLEGVNLGGAQLKGATLYGAQLEGVNLGGAQLEGAYLYGAQLKGAYLGGAQLERTVLTQTDLTKVLHPTFKGLG
jgi:hypothetical protein